jgi:hypothetical protein
LAAVLIFIDRGQDRLWLAFVAVTGFGMEAFGVRFGFPFGRYEYSSMLQPQVLRVPLVLICAWVVMTAYARQSVSRLFASAAMRAAVGRAWMMALDLLIDPVATNAMSTGSGSTRAPIMAFPFRISPAGSWPARFYFRWQAVGEVYADPRQTRSA